MARQSNLSNSHFQKEKERERGQNESIKKETEECNTMDGWEQAKEHMAKEKTHSNR